MAQIKTELLTPRNFEVGDNALSFDALGNPARVITKPSESFDSLTSAAAFVTANPAAIERLSTDSYRNAAECLALSVPYPDGGGADYIVGTGFGTADGGSVIDAGGVQLKAIFKDEIPLEAFGVVFDGVTHSSVVVSHWLDYAISIGKAKLTVGAGQVFLEVPVTKTFGGNLDISIVGAGTYLSEFIASATGGILLTSTARTSVIELRDFSMLSKTSRSGTALSYTVPAGGNQQKRVFTAESLYIGPETFDSTSESFESGLVAEGMFRPLIQNVYVTSGSVDDGSVGTVGISVDRSYKAHVSDCYVVDRVEVCYSDVGTEGEGGYHDSNTGNGGTVGLRRFRTSGDEPEFWITNCHFNSYDINIELAGNKYGWIENNLLYCQVVSSSGSIGSFRDIVIYQGRNIQVVGNSYRQPYQPARVHIYTDPNHATWGGDIIDLHCSDKLLAATATAYGQFTGASNRFEIELPREFSDESFVSYPSIDDILIVGDNCLNVFLKTIDRVVAYRNDATGRAFRLNKISKTPAVADSLAQQVFGGTNSAGDAVDYAFCEAAIINPTALSEDGVYAIFTLVGGVATKIADFGPGGINLLAGSYEVGGLAGANGSFVDNGGNTVTVTGGIITSLS